MSDDLLKALGRAARDDRAEADIEVKSAPALDEATREAWVDRAFAELPKPEKKGTLARRRILPFVGAGLALAAALALYVTTRENELPSYELAVQGSTREWRGDETAPQSKIQVRADGMIEILARPARPLTFPIEARAVATHDATTKTLPVDVSSQGVARVSGNVRELFAMPERGAEEWRVVLVIGERGHVPASLESRDNLRKTEIVVVVTPN